MGEQSLSPYEKGILWLLVGLLSGLILAFVGGPVASYFWILIIVGGLVLFNCPRCKRNIFWWKYPYLIRPLPGETCTKCGLALTKPYNPAADAGKQSHDD